VEVADPVLAELPWETLVLPGQDVPLVLQDRVQMYRATELAHPPAAVQVRGPLRILAVIASPDAGGGELLDYEAELAAIISAVEPARRGEGAFVQVLNWGSLAAIRQALLGQRFHVLHLSCHAEPGKLVLEDEVGRADPVDAARFAAEALPDDRGVPLIVLAGCSTALPAPSQQNGAAGRDAAGELAARTADALGGLAAELLGRRAAGAGGAGGGGDDGPGHRPVCDRVRRRGVPGAGRPPGSRPAGRGLRRPPGPGGPPPRAASG
jgi:hypothetical protein